MNILYLTMDGFDTPGPNNQMAMVMIREYLKAGHHVHLIQSHRTGQYADLPDMLLNQPNLTVKTINRKVINKTNFVVRYLDEIKWAFTSFAHWRKQIIKEEIVFLQSCPSAVYQLILLKLFGRTPVLFNIYDMWPGHAIDLGVMSSRFLYNVFRGIQRIAYACCSKIAVLSEDMEKKLVDEGVNKSKICIVPAWYDDTVAIQVPDEENRFMKKYNIKRDAFIVQFAGTIGYVFNYKVILSTAELLNARKEIRFEIIGDGAFKEIFVKEAKERGLRNINFYPLQPVDIVPDVYSACDIALIPLRKGVIGNGVPSKAPLLMACHKTIINSVEVDSEYYKLFNENGMGVAVPIDDAQGLADAIIDLYNNPKKRNNMADKAMEYSREFFSASVCTRKFMNAFEEMCR